MKKSDFDMHKTNEGALKNNEKPIQISLLVNSIYFFIESVFIMFIDKGYRLIAIHQGRLLTDKIYKTSRGARIAFLKIYGKKTWKDGIKAQWSRFYSPETHWIEDKFKTKN